MNWREYLKSTLRGMQRVAVLGIGSALSGDDSAGMMAVTCLEQMTLYPERLLVCKGSTAPENFAGPIINFAPEHILVLDAAYMGKELGEIDILSPEQLSNGELSTHMLPLPLLLSYLEKECGCGYTILGIQAGCTDFGTEPAGAVVLASHELAAGIISAMNIGWSA